MAIYKLIANGSFGPQEIEVMSAAYESALIDLGITNRRLCRPFCRVVAWLRPTLEPNEPVELKVP